jgi:hypothetical protein
MELLSMAKTVKAKKNIRAKTAVCKCLLCDRDADPRRRGLCSYHYHQFDSEKRKLPANKQGRFDDDQVRAGNILESRRGNKPKQPNPFAVVAT